MTCTHANNACHLQWRTHLHQVVWKQGASKVHVPTVQPTLLDLPQRHLIVLSLGHLGQSPWWQSSWHTCSSSVKVKGIKLSFSHGSTEAEQMRHYCTLGDPGGCSGSTWAQLAGMQVSKVTVRVCVRREGGRERDGGGRGRRGEGGKEEEAGRRQEGGRKEAGKRQEGGMEKGAIHMYVVLLNLTSHTKNWYFVSCTG